MPSTSLSLIRFLILDVVFDVVQLPVWWYTRGLVKALRWYTRQLSDGVDRLALLVLLRNLGRPMFGDYSREGRAISFAVRIVQIIVSFVLYAVWVVGVTAMMIAYLVVIPAVIIFIVYLWPHG